MRFRDYRYELRSVLGHDRGWTPRESWPPRMSLREAWDEYRNREGRERLAHIPFPVIIVPYAAKQGAGWPRALACGLLGLVVLLILSLVAVAVVVIEAYVNGFGFASVAIAVAVLVLAAALRRWRRFWRAPIDLLVLAYTSKPAHTALVTVVVSGREDVTRAEASLFASGADFVRAYSSQHTLGTWRLDALVRGDDVSVVRDRVERELDARQIAHEGLDAT